MARAVWYGAGPMDEERRESGPPLPPAAGGFLPLALSLALAAFLLSAFATLGTLAEYVRPGGLRDPMNLAEGAACAATATGDPAWEIEFLSKVQHVTLEDIRARWPYWESSARTRLILVPGREAAPLEGKK